MFADFEENFRRGSVVQVQDVSYSGWVLPKKKTKKKRLFLGVDEFFDIFVLSAGRLCEALSFLAAYMRLLNTE